MNWEERRRLQKQRPSRSGLAALADAVRPGAAVAAVRRLGGGLATATHLVTLRTPGGTSNVVVKRSLDAAREGSEGNGDLAPGEWARLRFVAALGLPTPGPLAFDAPGAWFGAPAIVMSALPGRPHVAPRDVGAFTAEIARTLAAIHASPISGAPASMKAPLSWEPPRRLRRTPLVSRALAEIGPRMPRCRHGAVIHGDFHPGNLLWSRGRISGVVDWCFAGIGPPAWDVAYCRTDLAVLLGGDAPDLLLEAYGGNGGELEHLRTFDLMCGVSAMWASRFWTVSYGEQGAIGLTPALARRRAAAFVRRALARDP